MGVLKQSAAPCYLAPDRRRLKREGDGTYERKNARGLVEEADVEKRDSTRLSSGHKIQRAYGRGAPLVPSFLRIHLQKTPRKRF